MSDISITFSPLDYLIIALIFASPGLVIGAGIGAFAWRRRRLTGAVAGAVIGGLLCVAGAYLRVVLWN